MGQDREVAARPGDAQAEHVADAAEVAAAGMEFVQDPVLSGLLGGHPPALFTVGKPEGKPVPDRSGQRDGALAQMEAPVVDI